MSKAVATALYLEFRRENHTSQVILVPPYNNTLSGAFEAPRIITRQISSENPRRPWKFFSSSALESTPTDLLGREADVDKAAMKSLPVLNELSSFFAGYHSGGWQLYRTPVSVELSQDDINDITAKETPNAFLRRVLRARGEAGFSEDLFDEHPASSISSTTATV